ncbi:MAG: hypothetical protein BWX70_02817 [Verrucomicrobia bacterium ADurb.Bin070]|nr:MAG: hypothetical protein BWX70_02817 [Verrucomicrobia bacterium ADurb.Bin070]
MNLERAQHEALVGDRVEVVELRHALDHRVFGILFIHRQPAHGVRRAPGGTAQEIVALAVVARPSAPTGPQAVNPFTTKRIVEHRTAVAGAAGDHAIDPVDAVRRGHAYAGDCPARPAHEHLVALLRIGRLPIGHHGPRVGRQIRRQHLIGSRHHIQLRPLPIQTVGAGGVADGVDPAGLVPELEQPFIGIPPEPAALRHGCGVPAAVQFQLGLRAQHRVPGIFLGHAEDALQCAGRDQEIIHEQLPAHIDGNHFRRRGQIRHRHRRPVRRIHGARRPIGREFDSIVKPLAASGQEVERRRRPGGLRETGQHRPLGKAEGLVLRDLFLIGAADIKR